MRPPEITQPAQTDAEHLQQSIERSLRGIRDRWPYMWGNLIHRGQRIGNGSASNRITAPDQTPHLIGSDTIPDLGPTIDHDVPAIDVIASLRREITEALNATACEVVEERGIEQVITRWGGRAHTVNGKDALDLIAFLLHHAQWISTMSGDPDYTRDMLRGYAAKVAGIVDPYKRTTMSLGPCPLEIPGDADVLGPCAGTVRVRLEGDRDGEAYAVCDHCGESAVWSWWEKRMYPDPELQALLTAPEVVTFLHRAYSISIEPSTVRKWVERKRLASCGTDDEGRSLFAREAVIFAYETWRLGTRLLKA